jgi:hypothetical protein
MESVKNLHDTRPYQYLYEFWPLTSAKVLMAYHDTNIAPALRLLSGPSKRTRVKLVHKNAKITLKASLMSQTPVPPNRTPFPVQTVVIKSLSVTTNLLPEQVPANKVSENPAKGGTGENDIPHFDPSATICAPPSRSPAPPVVTPIEPQHQQYPKQRQLQRKLPLIPSTPTVEQTSPVTAPVGNRPSITPAPRVTLHRPTPQTPDCPTPGPVPTVTVRQLHPDERRGTQTIGTGNPDRQPPSTTLTTQSQVPPTHPPAGPQAAKDNSTKRREDEMGDRTPDPGHFTPDAAPKGTHVHISQTLDVTNLSSTQAEVSRDSAPVSDRAHVRPQRPRSPTVPK